MTVFISYAHDDQAYVDVFIKEFEKHANLAKDLKWVTWTDKNMRPGNPWHKDMQRRVEECDFAILLVSTGFLNSKYIEKNEFNNFLKQAGSGEDRFLFFPVLLEHCEFSTWEELEKRQFFMPKGVKYGKPHLDHISYADLVEFNKTNGIPLPDPMRKRYMIDLVKTLEDTLKQYKPSTQKKKEKSKYFKWVKPAGELILEDILNPGKRASINKNFYWRRTPDNVLDEHLKNNRPVLIVGNSLSGKTRALYEALKKLENTTVLAPKEILVLPTENEDEPLLPETGDGRYVAVFDDIDRILGKNTKETLENFLFLLMEKKVIIAATCRRGNEFRLLENMLSSRIRENLEMVFINRMTENQVMGFKTFFAKKTMNKGILDEKAFDGNIGSFFMDLSVMYERYVNLEKHIKAYDHLFIPDRLPREILKALKYFYYTENTEGKVTFSIEKIKDFCERSLLGKRFRPKGKDKADKPGIRKEDSKAANPWQQQLDRFASPKSKEEFSTVEWNDTFAVLSDSDYELNFIRLDEPFIQVEEVYLERVVENRLPLNRVIGILQDVYKGEDLQRHGFLTSVFGFTKLINLARSAEEAYNMLLKLKALGIKPDEVAFNSLINKAENFKEALSFLGKMKENNIPPNVVTFNSLIYKAENFKEALSFLEKMKENNIQPNEVTFTSLINKAENFSDALSFLNMMKENNIQPEAVTFNSLINKAENFSDAVIFLDKMKEIDLKPEETTFNSLINKATSFSDAVTYLDKMKEHGLKADAITFTTMINKAESFKEAFTFLEKMAEHDIKPSVFIYSSLFGKADTPKDIFVILKHMKTQGLLPNKFTTDLLIKKIKQNPRQTLEDLFAAFSPTDIFKDLLLNRFINEACRADSAGLEYIIPHVETIGSQKDSVIIYYARLFEYNGAAATALKILENIKTPSFDFYNIKANCFKTTDFSQALELYKKALETTTDKDPGQKAIVWNNIAQLIFDHKQTALYDEAIAYCRAALKIRSYYQFPYPGDLLILFTIEQSPLETVKENIENILKTYHINKNALTALTDKIDSPEKKEVIKQLQMP
ncbi:MAG TPA: TIR domain-containing protein [Candidatus Kapabacteria bacterium]|nr:TIR domain-containing protein [Candidatus Kapabacteria bacterium]